MRSTGFTENDLSWERLVGGASKGIRGSLCSQPIAKKLKIIKGFCPEFNQKVAVWS